MPQCPTAGDAGVIICVYNYMVGGAAAMAASGAA